MRKIYCDRCGKPIEGVTEFGVSTFCKEIKLQHIGESWVLDFARREVVPAKWECCLNCIKDIENYILHGAETAEKTEKAEETEETPRDNLPSVNPQPKTGHWITTRTFMHDGEFYCDRCKCDSPQNEKWDYCPNCGAKMVEPQESEE